MAERHPSIQAILERVNRVQLIEKDELEPLRREGYLIGVIKASRNELNHQIIVASVSPNIMQCGGCHDPNQPSLP